MSRIAACLANLQQSKRKALVPYIVAGDPDLASLVPAMHAMVAAGADILEIGIPFSDPMAEGPVIQLAHERALVHGVTLKHVLDEIRVFRQDDQDTPVVLMGYANPIEALGYEQFACLASDAGIDGVLIVDMPPEESADLRLELDKASIDIIFLVAPTTTSDRIKIIAEAASGYLYYVSLKGVTGAGHLDISSVNENVARIRAISDIPLCVGFGIKDGESARQISACADGAVVGSVLVSKIAELASRSDCSSSLVASELAKMIGAIRLAMDKDA